MTVVLIVLALIAGLALGNAWWKLCSRISPPDPPVDLGYWDAVAVQRRIRVQRERWRRESARRARRAAE